MNRSPQEINGGVPGGNYDAVQAANGTWTIKGLPIFSEVEAGKRGNERHVGPEWMNAAIAKAKELRLVQQHMAPVHLGHHGALKNKDTPRVGFLKPTDIARLLIEGKPSWVLNADVVGISQENFESLKNLSHPYRSVEIGDWNKPEIASLALLSDESPYFKFPMLTIGQMKEHKEHAGMQFESDGNFHFFEFADEIDIYREGAGGSPGFPSRKEPGSKRHYGVRLWNPSMLHEEEGARLVSPTEWGIGRRSKKAGLIMRPDPSDPTGPPKGPPGHVGAEIVLKRGHIKPGRTNERGGSRRMLKSGEGGRRGHNYRLVGHQRRAWHKIAKSLNTSIPDMLTSLKETGQVHKTVGGSHDHFIPDHKTAEATRSLSASHRQSKRELRTLVGGQSHAAMFDPHQPGLGPNPKPKHTSEFHEFARKRGPKTPQHLRSSKTPIQPYSSRNYSPQTGRIAVPGQAEGDTKMRFLSKKSRVGRNTLGRATNLSLSTILGQAHEGAKEAGESVLVHKSDLQAALKGKRAGRKAMSNVNRLSSRLARMYTALNQGRTHSVHPVTGRKEIPHAGEILLARGANAQQIASMHPELPMAPQHTSEFHEFGMWADLFLGKKSVDEYTGARRGPRSGGIVGSIKKVARRVSGRPKHKNMRDVLNSIYSQEQKALARREYKVAASQGPAALKRHLMKTTMEAESRHRKPGTTYPPELQEFAVQPPGIETVSTLKRRATKVLGKKIRSSRIRRRVTTPGVGDTFRQAGRGLRYLWRKASQSRPAQFLKKAVVDEYGPKHTEHQLGHVKQANITRQSTQGMKDADRAAYVQADVKTHRRGRKTEQHTGTLRDRGASEQQISDYEKKRAGHETSQREKDQWDIEARTGHKSAEFSAVPIWYRHFSGMPIWMGEQPFFFNSQPTDHVVRNQGLTRMMKGMARSNRTSTLSPGGRIDGQGFHEFTVTPPGAKPPLERTPGGGVVSHHEANHSEQYGDSGDLSAAKHYIGKVHRSGIEYKTNLGPAAMRTYAEKFAGVHKKYDEKYPGKLSGEYKGTPLKVVYTNRDDGGVDTHVFDARAMHHYPFMDHMKNVHGKNPPNPILKSLRMGKAPGVQEVHAVGGSFVGLGKGAFRKPTKSPLRKKSVLTHRKGWANLVKGKEAPFEWHEFKGDPRPGENLYLGIGRNPVTVADVEKEKKRAEKAGPRQRGESRRGRPLDLSTSGGTLEHLKALHKKVTHTQGGEHVRVDDVPQFYRGKYGMRNPEPPTLQGSRLDSIRELGPRVRPAKRGSVHYKPGLQEDLGPPDEKGVRRGHLVPTGGAVKAGAEGGPPIKEYSRIGPKSRYKLRRSIDRWRGTLSNLGGIPRDWTPPRAPKLNYNKKRNPLFVRRGPFGERGPIPIRRGPSYTNNEFLEGNVVWKGGRPWKKPFIPRNAGSLGFHEFAWKEGSGEEWKGDRHDPSDPDNNLPFKPYIPRGPEGLSLKKGVAPPKKWFHHERRWEWTKAKPKDRGKKNIEHGLTDREVPGGYPNQKGYWPTGREVRASTQRMGPDAQEHIKKRMEKEGISYKEGATDYRRTLDKIDRDFGWSTRSSSAHPNFKPWSGVSHAVRSRKGYVEPGPRGTGLHEFIERKPGRRGFLKALTAGVAGVGLGVGSSAAAGAVAKSAWPMKAGGYKLYAHLMTHRAKRMHKLGISLPAGIGYEPFSVPGQVFHKVGGPPGTPGENNKTYHKKTIGGGLTGPMKKGHWQTHQGQMIPGFNEFSDWRSHTPNPYYHGKGGRRRDTRDWRTEGGQMHEFVYGVPGKEDPSWDDDKQKVRHLRPWQVAEERVKRAGKRSDLKKGSPSPKNQPFIHKKSHPGWVGGLNVQSNLDSKRLAKFVRRNGTLKGVYTLGRDGLVHHHVWRAMDAHHASVHLYMANKGHAPIPSPHSGNGHFVYGPDEDEGHADGFTRSPTVGGNQGGWKRHNAGDTFSFHEFDAATSEQQRQKREVWNPGFVKMNYAVRLAKKKLGIDLTAPARENYGVDENRATPQRLKTRRTMSPKGWDHRVHNHHMVGSHHMYWDQLATKENTTLEKLEKRLHTTGQVSDDPDHYVPTKYLHATKNSLKHSRKYRSHDSRVMMSGRLPVPKEINTKHDRLIQQLGSHKYGGHPPDTAGGRRYRNKAPNRANVPWGEGTTGQFEWPQPSYRLPNYTSEFGEGYRSPKQRIRDWMAHIESLRNSPDWPGRVNFPPGGVKAEDLHRFDPNNPRRLLPKKKKDNQASEFSSIPGLAQAQPKRILNRRAAPVRLHLSKNGTMAGQDLGQTKDSPLSRRTMRGEAHSVASARLSEFRGDRKARWLIQPPGVGWYSEFNA